MAAIALLGGGGLYLFGFVLDPVGRDAGTLVQNRILGGAAAFILFFVAAGLTAKARPRIAAGYRGLAILGAIGAIDAVLLLIHLAEWIRNLVFLLGGLLLVTLVLGQLRRRRTGEVQDALDFFSRNWALVAFLLFLIVARVGADQPLRTVMPSLLVNVFFLLAFLSGLFTLTFRYLKAFGSPISWNEAKHHEQEVGALRDPQMEGLREILRAYVERGERYEPYQALVRDLAVRNETPSGAVEPLLARPPPLLSTAVPAAPPLLRILAALLVSFGAAFPLSAIALPSGPFVIVLLLAFAAGAFFAPIVDGILRPATDRASALLWLAGGIAAAGSLAATALSLGTMGLVGLGAIVLVHGGMALRALLARRSKAPPPAAVHKVEAGRRQGRHGIRLIWTGGAITAFVVLYLSLGPALKDWVEVPQMPIPIMMGLIGAGLAFAGAGYLLGPNLKRHREQLDQLHEQEKSQRNAFHLHIVQILEGA
ncbi:MAG TPA: hypothetical protein VI818_08590 [Candidatus Thermoplasmatota archaeon]|nr:hypothetical protein [Candidatus Thermoplasmatota archaeon]